MAKHPVMKGLDHDKLLWSVVCCASGPSMSRTLMLQRIEVDSIVHDLRIRYKRLFEWLSGVREKALKYGYIEGPKGRKYMAGLKSSNVEKRKRALDEAVRWLIGS
jgi:DNA polymerase I-like protein with 3'-5' exonuclease and polymerase domains